MCPLPLKPGFIIPARTVKCVACSADILNGSVICRYCSTDQYAGGLDAVSRLGLVPRLIIQTKTFDNPHVVMDDATREAYFNRHGAARPSHGSSSDAAGKGHSKAKRGSPSDEASRSQPHQSSSSSSSSQWHPHNSDYYQSYNQGWSDSQWDDWYRRQGNDSWKNSRRRYT